MYKIQGPFDEKPQAIQQDKMICSNLNSQEAYFVVAPGGGKCWSWHGEGASKDEAAYGDKLHTILAPHLDSNPVAEKYEDDEFWAALGGKGEYPDAKMLAFAPGFEPKLYHLSNSQGYFHMKEIYNFVQSDLNNNDVMCLDMYSTFYCWAGAKSNKHEKNNAIKKVEKFVGALSDGRTADMVQIMEIEPFGEPMMFRSAFPEWEDEVCNMWLEDDPYTAMMKKI